MPLSAAIFFARGEAKIRPFEVLLAARTGSVTAALAVFFGSFFSEVVFSVGAGAHPLAMMALTSEPAGPMMVNKLSTGAVSPS